MTHLGDFGKARESADFTFGWFGKLLRVNPSLSDLAILDIVEIKTAASGSDAIRRIRDIGNLLIHPDDAGEFWALARANRQTMEDIANLSMDLISAVTGRPTSLPSDSSDGQQPTAPSSTADSSSQALRLLESRNRPDLAVAVVRAQEAMSAS